MTARKKKSTGRSNSNVQSAQRTAVERRLERTQATKAAEDKQAEANKTGASKPFYTGGAIKPSKLEPVGGPLATRHAGIDQDAIAVRDNVAGKSMSAAVDKIAGLASGVMSDRQAATTAETKRALADTTLYGTSDRNIKDRLTALRNAADQTRRAQLAKTGSAVYLGAKNERIRRQQRGGDFEGGTNRTPEMVQTDDIRNKDELMSWLADEKTFNQIKERANKAGLAVVSYDDVAKLWKSVVDQAAATYSTTGKKITPWALMSLRGKTMVGGRPSDKTTVSSSVQEMDPAQARLIFEKSASDYLGRAAKPEEIDDFISKAQTIARANPNVTTTTTQYGFDGNATGQQSSSTGGADAVAAQSQVAATDIARQDEEYGAFQAAGVMFPWLTDALRSPV